MFQRQASKLLKSSRCCRTESSKESTSPWSSPIVMVPMPDGSTRQSNDFQRLNQVSEFDNYLFPDSMI